MSEIKLLLDEIQALKRRIQALETVAEHPGYAASDVARLSQDNLFTGVQTIQQANLSGEFIRFDTTVGSGNPINTTALGAYYGRARSYVEGVGEKWLALYDT